MSLLMEGVLNPNNAKGIFMSGEAPAALPTEGVLNPNNSKGGIYEQICG
jgi:hypothetical protein